jgi:hypothetical protein
MAAAESKAGREAAEAAQATAETAEAAAKENEVGRCRLTV